MWRVATLTAKVLSPLSLSLSLSLTHTRTHTHARTYVHTLSLSLSHTHTHTLSLTPSLSPLSRSLSYTAFRDLVKLEVIDLSEAPGGGGLLQCIGYVYEQALSLSLSLSLPFLPPFPFPSLSRTFSFLSISLHLSHSHFSSLSYYLNLFSSFTGGHSANGSPLWNCAFSLLIPPLSPSLV